MEEQIQLRVSESMAQLQLVRSTPFVHGAEDGLDADGDDPHRHHNEPPPTDADNDGAALRRQGTSVPYSPGVERVGAGDHAPAAAAHSDHDGEEPVPFDDLDLGSPATARARATALDMSRPRPLLLTPEALVAKQVQCGVDMEESEVMVQLARMHLKALGEPPASIKNTRVARVLM